MPPISNLVKQLANQERLASREARKYKQLFDLCPWPGSSRPNASVDRPMIRDFVAAFGRGSKSRNRIELGQPLEVVFVSGGKAREREVAYESPIMRSLREAGWILDLDDDWDGEGSPGYAPATWDQVERFLKRLERESRRYLGREMPAPAIDPADQGSIDLFWEMEDRRLLVNVPHGTDEPISFFAQDQTGFTMSGEIPRAGSVSRSSHLKERERAVLLASWLTDD